MRLAGVARVKSGEQMPVQGELFLRQTTPPTTDRKRLRVTFDAQIGGYSLEWRSSKSGPVLATGTILPHPEGSWDIFALQWTFQMGPNRETADSPGDPASVDALWKRITERLPLDPDQVQLFMLLSENLGNRIANYPYELESQRGQNTLETTRYSIREFALWVVQAREARNQPPELTGRALMLRLIQRRVLGTNAEEGPARQAVLNPPPTARAPHRLQVVLDAVRTQVLLDWYVPDSPTPAQRGSIRCSGLDRLDWELTDSNTTEVSHTTHHLNSIRAQLRRWRSRFPVRDEDVRVRSISPGKTSGAQPLIHEREPLAGIGPWMFLEDDIQRMAFAGRYRFSALGRMQNSALSGRSGSRSEEPPLSPTERRRLAEEQHRKESLRRSAETLRKTSRAPKHAEPTAPPPPKPTESAPRIQRPPPPPVPLRIENTPLSFQETNVPLTDLRGYFLKERAAQWWVSNQSDDLLALPYCKIERLEYQIRSALRVVGPLRGRALLSDEVGLGKTVEAGLVLKEWLTRGMVRRFLVLTTPSLVDQWEEELADKFDIATSTTNHAAFRTDPKTFWSEGQALVASLSTLRQSTHIEIARTVNWDLIIVDEAHHLRNRDSQSWQAVNDLPRQFLLLLTATPVQNSLEELYNLVTLLQPGQLPSPKEFRARFMDPKRPRQPKEPEELRRLLGQVMIRNTRANAGISLPPRRAETVLLEPTPDERTFWTDWESELRTALKEMSLSQASLWGRLLLQAAGSSPAAWSSALAKFPNNPLARKWTAQARLDASWQRKCALIQPLARSEGGLVVFTQFLATQAALAERLATTGVKVFVIHGGTPAASRQPITEQFRKDGGVLLLTHCGTEGRNLQFCRSLLNFDLPWNPMEIEQRIGRLHRLGQKHAVHIYNLVQSGTLQEHLLDILQEKLNLFELVVGETGLVLGERFTSDEFAEEILRRWRDSDGRVAEALQELGQDLAEARDGYQQLKQLDETLFAKDYEML